jgi:hypothetical protein
MISNKERLHIQLSARIQNTELNTDASSRGIYFELAMQVITTTKLNKDFLFLRASLLMSRSSLPSVCLL